MEKQQIFTHEQLELIIMLKNDIKGSSVIRKVAC